VVSIVDEAIPGFPPSPSMMICKVGLPPKATSVEPMKLNLINQTHIFIYNGDVSTDSENDNIGFKLMACTFSPSNGSLSSLLGIAESVYLICNCIIS
jgi:hypothetical protein